MVRARAAEIYELHARLCKAIADPKRLLIIDVLRDGARTVSEIVDALGIYIRFEAHRSPSRQEVRSG